MTQTEPVHRLSFSAAQYRRLIRHLFRGTCEEVAFLFCSWHDALDGKRLTVQESYEVPADEFVYHSSFHVELSEAVRPVVIKRAWDTATCLVEAHSHRTRAFRAEFSGSDLAGLREFVPHVRWRLSERPYAALVFTEDQFDALLWAGRGSDPVGLDEIVVGESERFRPTSATLHRLNERGSCGRAKSI